MWNNTRKTIKSISKTMQLTVSVGLLHVIVHRKKVNLLRDIGPVKNGKKEYKYCSVSL